jgi:predicted outer membrane protein
LVEALLLEAIEKADGRRFMKTKIFGAVMLGLVSVGSLRAQTDLDRLFLSKVSEGDFAEIELSQLALIKTSNAKVKALPTIRCCRAR